MNYKSTWLYRNTANIITSLRIPISLTILFCGKDVWLVLFLALCAALTDFLDGKIAASMGIKSKFGGELDCIVDKFFFGALFFVLMNLPLPIWLKVMISATAIIEFGLLYYWILGISQGMDASTTKINGRRYGPGQYKMFAICVAVMLCLAKLLCGIQIDVLDCAMWAISIACATWSLLARRAGYLKVTNVPNA